MYMHDRGTIQKDTLEALWEVTSSDSSEGKTLSIRIFNSEESFRAKQVATMRVDDPHNGEGTWIYKEGKDEEKVDTIGHLCLCSSETWAHIALDMYLNQ